MLSWNAATQQLNMCNSVLKQCYNNHKQWKVVNQALRGNTEYPEIDSISTTLSNKEDIPTAFNEYYNSIGVH